MESIIMPKRYAATKVLTNSSEYYEPLRKPRGLKKLVQYATPKLYHPTASERRALQTTQHIYKYGDRLYTLAYKFYGKAEYWWIIAWFNGYPTEVDIPNGASLSIPINLEAALNVLRV